MNATLLRPRLASLIFSGCVLASAVTLHADDREYIYRDHRPVFHRFFGPARFAHPRHRVVYIHPRYITRSHVIPDTVETGSAIAPDDEPITNPGKRQHLEIPLNPDGPKIDPSADDIDPSLDSDKPEKPVKPKSRTHSSSSSDLAPLPDTGKKDIAPSESKAALKDVPVASRASKPGFVKSPFEPYAELGAPGMYPGMLAKDPTTGKIFRMP